MRTAVWALRQAQDVGGAEHNAASALCSPAARMSQAGPKSAANGGYATAMNALGTIHLVPPIAPSAMARAVMSFATYLAALDWPVMIAGRASDPLALSLGVVFIAIIARNLTTARNLSFYRSNPKLMSFVLLIGLTGIAALILFASAKQAAGIVISYYAAYAAWTYAMGRYCPEELHHLGYPPADDTGRVALIAQLDAVGFALTATTLICVWSFAGAFAFAAAISFGILVIRFMMNWVIVLILLDRDAQDDTR